MMMNWKIKNIDFLFGWALLALVCSCGGNTTATTTGQPTSESQPVNTAVSPEATQSPAQTRESGKPKHFTIDTNSSAERANYKKPTAATPTPTPIIDPEKLHEKPIGPPGFVTQDGTVLYAEQNTGSAHLATMKKSENVYILETSMKNDKGGYDSVPTWFKVQRKTKKKETGWVIGKFLDSGGGG